MIDRYAIPELRELFSETRKLALWLKIELLVAEAMHARGLVPDDDWERIRDSAALVDVARAHEIEEESQHDVIAFLRSVTERLGPGGAVAALRPDQLRRSRHRDSCDAP